MTTKPTPATAAIPRRRRTRGGISSTMPVNCASRSSSIDRAESMRLIGLFTLDHAAQFFLLVLGQRALQHPSLAGERLERLEDLVRSGLANEHEERGTAGGEGCPQVLHELVVDTNVREFSR